MFLIVYRNLIISDYRLRSPLCTIYIIHSKDQGLLRKKDGKQSKSSVLDMSRWHGMVIVEKNSLQFWVAAKYKICHYFITKMWGTHDFKPFTQGLCNIGQATGTNPLHMLMQGIRNKFTG